MFYLPKVKTRKLTFPDFPIARVLACDLGFKCGLTSAEEAANGELIFYLRGGIQYFGSRSGRASGVHY